MTIEELIQPRIKVIAPYPDMDCNVGDIIELPSIEWIYSDGEYCNEDYFKSWPHLFAPLPWYAERNPGDMPHYVKFRKGIYKVVEYEVRELTKNISRQYVVFENASKNIKAVIPATEADYQAYIK